MPQSNYRIELKKTVACEQIFNLINLICFYNFTTFTYNNITMFLQLFCN